MPKFPDYLLDEENPLTSRPSPLMDAPPVPLRDPALMQPQIDFPPAEPEMLQGMTLPQSEIQDLIKGFEAKKPKPVSPLAGLPEIKGDVKPSSDLRAILDQYSKYKTDNSAMDALQSRRGDIAGYTALAQGMDKAAQAVQRAYGAQPGDMSDVIGMGLARSKEEIEAEKENQKRLEKDMERKLAAFKEMHSLDKSDRDEARTDRKTALDEKKFEQDYKIGQLNLNSAESMMTPGSDESKFVAGVAHSNNPKLDKEMLEKLPGATILKMLPHIKEKATSELGLMRLQVQKDRMDLYKQNMERRYAERDEDQKRAITQQVKSYQDGLQRDPLYKAFKKQGAEFNDIQKILDLSREGNQNAFSALGIKVAKALGEAGAMSEKDVTRYVQGTSAPRKFADMMMKMKEGRPSGASLDDIQELGMAFQVAAQEKLKPIYDNHAALLSRNLDVPLGEAYYKLNAPDSFYENLSEQEPKAQAQPIAPAAPIATKPGEVRRATDDGKIAIFDSATKKFIRFEDGN